MKNKNILIIGTFFSFIFLIGIINVFTPVKLFSTAERRKLKQKPELTYESLLKGSYTSDYEEYFNDQFIYRDKWINLNTLGEVLMGKKEINNVYLGRDNYLIENTSEYNEENLQNNLKIIRESLNFLDCDSIKVMLVPNTGNVQKDKLPLFAQVMNQEEILERAEKDFDGSLVNVYPVLTEHAHEYIYYKTDHHWTTLGAFYAYSKWAEDTGHSQEKVENFSRDVVCRDFLGTLYAKINYSRVKDVITLFNKDKKYKVSFDLEEGRESSLYELSYLETDDKYSTFLNGDHALVKIESENKNGESLLVFKDSYANSFIPFIASDYEEVYVIDLRYYNGSIKSFMSETDISDVLLLFNLNSLADNKTLYKILR